MRWRLLSIYTYRRYSIIPYPLEAFIIKNKEPLGIVIERNRDKKEGSKHQRKYPKNILKKYGQKETENLKHSNNPIPCLYSDKGK